MRILLLLAIFSRIFCEELQNSTEVPKRNSGISCEANQFKCTLVTIPGEVSHLCIPATWVCDGSPDCPDGSDEYNCSCKTGQFQCALTRKCIPKPWMCDKEYDCGTTADGVEDLSDELDKSCKSEKTCLINEVDCGNNSFSCVHLAKFCDKKLDCLNQYDEGDHCAKPCDLDCSYRCANTPKGPQCYCPEGQQPVNTTECTDYDECLVDSSCDQMCTNTEGSYTCSCTSGYTKISQKGCEAINVPAGEKATLIYSTSSKIARITLDGERELASIAEHPFSFAVDHRQERVCFVNANSTSPDITCLNAISLNKSDVPDPQPAFPLSKLTHIALDWVSGNWYFLDELREIIYICTNSMKYCTIIIEVNISKPRGVALDPTKGYMFFTHWGSNSSPRLERALMDGTERTFLVVKKIVYPCGVTVDFPKEHVYWVDSYLFNIERVDFDGKNRKNIGNVHPMLYLFDVTTFENDLYFTSWRTSSVMRTNKFNSSSTNFILVDKKVLSVHVYHRQRQPDVAHPCKVGNGQCQHICVPAWNNNIGYANCYCHMGYRLLKSGKCIYSTSQFLLFGQGRPGMIRGKTVSSRLEDIMVPITDLVRPSSVDYDIETQYIYYSDVRSLHIGRQKLNGTKKEIVIDTGINNCEGLAVDWLGRNLYWTDEGLATINVAPLENPAFRKVLINENLAHPKDIILDPNEALMYWCQWDPIVSGRGKIEVAYMDGTKRRTFVEGEMQWPTGLTLDTMRRQLYWADAYLDKIERINTEGNKRTVIDIEVHHLDHPFGLTYLDNMLYWTELQSGNIGSLNLTSNVVRITRRNPPLFHIKAFDVNFMQQGVEKCPNCSHLCLLGETKTCACADGYKLNGTDCVASPDMFTTHSIRRCPSNEFQCVNTSSCIKQTYVCDGDEDCKDGSDEDRSQSGPCYNRTCPLSQLQCDGSRCVSKRWLCDGEKDCIDGADEEPAACVKDPPICLPDQFQCNITKRCIPRAWVCDSQIDCGNKDNSDEEGCEKRECSIIDEFTCLNGRCIPLTYVCDSDDDCGDDSDEHETECPACSQDQFRCLGFCLPKEVLCDGRPDCSDRSDELNCSMIEKSGSHDISYHHDQHGDGIVHHKNESILEDPFCKTGYPCPDGSCISLSYVCDGIKQCLDGFDEFDCNEVNCEHSHGWKCDNDTKCIEKEQLCDGKSHCQDGSDEGFLANCTLNCEYPYGWKCDNNTNCVELKLLCDGKSHCSDGSDEGILCGEEQCPSDCSHDCHPTPLGRACTCREGTYLQPDNRSCVHSPPCSNWGTCSQGCHQMNRTSKCYCFEGYTLQDDHFSCKSNDPAVPYVIFSNRHELRGVDLRTFNVKALISSLKNTIALDFHHTDKMLTIYWTDVIDDKIYRGSLIGGTIGNIEVVVQTGLATAEGLAVDWVAGNLYWVESNLDQIEVAKLDGKYRRALIAGDMESPRAIALDPRYGLLFWTDWDANAPRIERCAMTGEDRKIIVYIDQISNGAWPNGLTLDYQLKRVFWIDARSDSIHSVTYEGTSHQLVLSGHELLSHPFAISLYESHVYWTDWRSNSVLRANKWNGEGVFVLQRTLTQPFDIQVLHPSRQPKADYNPCGVNNGNCSHLCLLGLNSTRKCACPHVMRLDQEDGTTCIVNDVVLLFSRPNEIRGVDLNQTHYHTIPTISLPQVVNPTELDYHASAKCVFWTDTSSGVVKRASLDAGLSGTSLAGIAETIIDTGIEYPRGFAIDWISGNMFVSSSREGRVKISACNENGQFVTIVYYSDKLEGTLIWHDLRILSLAVDPTRGKLYWSEKNDSSCFIKGANMDASEMKVLSSNKENPDLIDAISLTMDFDMNRLYWVNEEVNNVQYLELSSSRLVKLQLPESCRPGALTVYGNKVYIADHYSRSIVTFDKSTGANQSLVRDNTGNILSLKIYDPKVQQGTNACAKNKGNCAHLCLPVSPTSRVCACATGYRVDPNNHTLCIGIDEFLIYSINWEIRGISLDPNQTNENDQVLGPISRVSMATSIDFDPVEDYLYWADSDHGTVTRVHRDGTGRQMVVGHFESTDSVPVDWLTGLAVDWVAGNLYWADPKSKVIEVSRTDGRARYVVVQGDGLERPHSLAVDPATGAGVLFWLDRALSSRVFRSQLDGGNRAAISVPGESSGSVILNDIALDRQNKFIYFCDSHINQIFRMDYSGNNYDKILDHSLVSPFALTYHKGFIYWIDLASEKGSLKMAEAKPNPTARLLSSGLGDSLKDLTVVTSTLEAESNPCDRKTNHGCEQLCLFNGVRAVCACAHGRVAEDGKSCEDYDSFLIYSLVDRIDSVHLTGDVNLNAPFPSVHSKELMRNCIGLTYDFQTSTIFYSDIQKGSINAVHFNGSNHRVIVERQGSAEGLAYGVSENSLYWTCNNIATIYKMSLSKDPMQPEIVLKLAPSDKPRGIAIDACDSRLYWTNWNTHHPSIQRAFTNGFEKESIITKDIRMPNGLALDYLTEKLYWGDARLDKIERCDYNGANRVVLTKATPQHPFDLAVFGEYVFWTDWVQHAVIRANKHTGDEVVWLRKDVPRPMGIAAVANASYDCFLSPCRVLNGGCSDICRLDSHGAVQCSCPASKKLDEDGKRCVFNSSATTNGSACSDDEFQCTDNICIPYSVTCDLIKHCPDGSDEEVNYCATRTCKTGYHQCTNGRCISESKLCDGTDDCGDGTDETNCTCDLRTDFQCKTHQPGQQCIRNKYRCDYDPDCLDASDEMGCPPRNCSLTGQRMTLINCNYTTACIHPSWICDEHNDCWDNSDEANCTYNTSTQSSTCPPKMFKCEENNLCIKEEWRCDGENDCVNGSDEKNCSYTCNESQFQCANSVCIPLSWECDGTVDCKDGSDESENCKGRECPANQFKCNLTGKCIPLGWVCDSTYDCTDKTDEQSCLSHEPCLLPTQFQCNNGKCIEQEYYCDGENDCDDKSDEPPTCANEDDIRCRDNEFLCRNGRCIILSLVCNGFDDCGDSTDEDMDSSFCKNVSCNFADGVFECANGLCLNKTLICDGENNCGDYSDEDGCNINECESHAPCSQICTDFNVGYICSCRPGFKPTYPFSPHCVDEDECDWDYTVPSRSGPVCSQLCTNRNGGYECDCVDGYELRPDGFTCSSTHKYPTYLIFANKYYIRKLDLQTKKVSILTQNLTNAVGLDYDIVEDCWYWSDVTAVGSSIQRLCKGDTEKKSLHSSVIPNPDGIAVDWVGRNLYWCDKRQDTIEVSKLDGKFRKMLINKGLMEPRAIALFPQIGEMFWSDWGDKPYIGKAWMDGSNIRQIITTNLGWPNALTIDYDMKLLYWGDARYDYISISDLNGGNRKVLFDRAHNSEINLHHIFALTVFENHIFWTDWETKTIEMCHKTVPHNCSGIATTIHRPMDIRVFHPYRQRPVEKNPCENNGGCDTLCLLQPEGRKTCACPDSFVPSVDNANKCVDNCTQAQFRCETTYKCIPFWWKCDEMDDCGDNSDEPENCPPFKCVAGQFQCDNGNCTHPSQICNAKDDCGDASDEVNCDTYPCMDSQYKCEGNKTVISRCISRTYRCDGKKDCPFGDDELDCDSECLDKSSHFKCANNKCIPEVWVCDSSDDCHDGSDELEELCTTRNCTQADAHRCASGRCLPSPWVCDGAPDCPDGSDEPPSCKVDMTCQATYFKCENNKCIPGRWRCDNEDDCGDESDEKNCVPRNCSESEFRCDNGRCIAGALKCDGEIHCEDSSDEKNCKKNCTEREFECVNPPKCIFRAWVCDGDRDCSDNSDEEGCADRINCDPDTHFRCHDRCIPIQYACDGEEDCNGGEDELLSVCEKMSCPPGRFRCGNHKCIAMTNVCDGVDHCRDGSDEKPVACQNAGRCESNGFRCDSGHCIAKKLHCDGNDDCGDLSDEKDCPQQCLPLSCSQLCIEKAGKGFSCHCAEGYTMMNDSCIANGEKGLLLVVGDAEYRLLDIYKPENSTRTVYYKEVPDDNLGHGSKIVAVAPDYANSLLYIAYSRRHIVPHHIDFEEKESKAAKPSILIDDFIEIFGVALDWGLQKLYVIIDDRIIVLSVNQPEIRSTLIKDLSQPRDIVLHAEQGQMYWISQGRHSPGLFSANADGTDMKYISKSCEGHSASPSMTGLALDAATQRIYWADVKRRTVESISLKDFSCVTSFVAEHMSNVRPLQVEIFEDWIYFTTYNNDIIKKNKVQRDKLIFVERNMTRITAIMMLQEQKQRNVTNPCEKNPCHKSAICLRTFNNKLSCICPDYYTSVKPNATGSKLECKEIPCDLNCNLGKCVMSVTGPKCVCPPLYEGYKCQRYGCHCKNKGKCLVDERNKVRCQCPTEFTGERCETLVSPCDLCLNGGHCVAKEISTKCHCPSGFTGAWCEHCPELQCQNGGICLRDREGKPACNCTSGYTGERCDIIHCNTYCQNGGTCFLTSSKPICICAEGFTGPKCEFSFCDVLHCYNGGTCELVKASNSSKVIPVCTCPPRFGGDHCKIDLCQQCRQCEDTSHCPACPEVCRIPPHCHCRNNGTCVTLQGIHHCKCDDAWSGTECELRAPTPNPCIGYCRNGGICTFLVKIKYCSCPFGFTGKRCDEADCRATCGINYKSCKLDAHNNILCLCKQGFSGTKCEKRLGDTSMDESQMAEDGNMLVHFVTFILIIVMSSMLGLYYYCYRIRNRRKSFSHRRMYENVEITNPLYDNSDDVTELTRELSIDELCHGLSVSSKPNQEKLGLLVNQPTS